MRDSGLLQYLATASANLVLVTDGMHYGWSSPSLPQIKNNTNSSLCVDEEESYWLSVMPLIGAVFGAIAAANIVDYLGRKNTIIATTIPFFVSWLTVGLATSSAYLLAARFVAGIADGISFTVIPMYIGEISAAKVRGQLMSSCSVCWIFGILLINIIGSYLSIHTAALISCAIPIVAFATFVFMPESPYYYLMKDKKTEAMESLRKLRPHTANVEKEIERMHRNILETSRKRGKFYHLFTVKSNRKAVIIVAGLRGFQQFSGTTAIMFYAQEIFRHAGDNISPITASLIYFSVMFAMTIFSSAIVDKAGRKPLLIISMTGAGFVLLLLSTYFYLHEKTDIDTSDFEIIPVVLMICYVVIFSLGMQSIPICMLGELFPTTVKAFALCLADVYYGIVASSASKFYYVTKDSYGIFAAFLGFGILSFVGLVFIVFCVPETKGKNLEEIQAYLRGEMLDARMGNSSETVGITGNGNWNNNDVDGEDETRNKA